MKKLSAILLSFIIFAAVLSFVGKKEISYAYKVSQGEAVMEINSGRMLYCQNEDAKLPMASTTKVVTAITVIDNYDIETEVTVPDECAGVEGSSVYLKSGDKFKVKDLLYGLMLRSGNDCAETLAVTLAGSIEKFAEQMNETAKKCGAENTNFKNPHGLHDEEHYTTARDLCKIACYAMKNPVFKEIVGSKKYTATELNEGTERIWYNKNKLLSDYDGANGVKTGFTKKAGRCLVSAAERDGMQVVAVVLNSPQMFERSKELLDYAFDNYKYVKIVDKDRFDYVIPDSGRKIYYKAVINDSFFYPVGVNETLSAEIDLPESLSEIPTENEKIGNIKIYCSKQLIFSQNIYTLK